MVMFLETSCLDTGTSLDCMENKSVNPSKKSTLKIHWEDWSWSWSSNALATWFEKPTHWIRPWPWERLRAGGEGGKEDEMVGWHHQLNGLEFEQIPGDSGKQGSLVCYSPWGLKESDMTAAEQSPPPHQVNIYKMFRRKLRRSQSPCKH